MSSIDRRDVIQGTALVAALAAVSKVQPTQAAAASRVPPCLFHDGYGRARPNLKSTHLENKA